MNIAKLAADGLNKAWAIIASELKACSLKVNPSAVYSAATDTTVTTWGQSVSLSAFFYGEKSEEKDATKVDEINTPERGIVAKAILRVSDCAGAIPNDRSEVHHGATVWRVLSVEAPPGNAIFILTLRK